MATHFGTSQRLAGPGWTRLSTGKEAVLHEDSTASSPRPPPSCLTLSGSSRACACRLSSTRKEATQDRYKGTCGFRHGHDEQVQRQRFQTALLHVKLPDQTVIHPAEAARYPPDTSRHTGSLMISAMLCFSLIRCGCQDTRTRMARELAAAYVHGRTADEKRVSSNTGSPRTGQARTTGRTGVE